MPDLKRKSLVNPQVLGDQPISAEILVGPNSLTITLAVPQLPRTDLDLALTRSTIRMRSKSDPHGVNFVVPLPVMIEPGRFVLRYKNGVYDFVVARASH